MGVPDLFGFVLLEKGDEQSKPLIWRNDAIRLFESFSCRDASFIIHTDVKRRFLKTDLGKISNLQFLYNSVSKINVFLPLSFVWLKITSSVVSLEGSSRYLSFLLQIQCPKFDLLHQLPNKLNSSKEIPSKTSFGSKRKLPHTFV